MTHKNILIIEDESLVAEDLKAHVIEMGYQVSAIVDNGEDALSLLEGSRPDLVLMDIVLAGGIDGIDVAEVIKEKYQIPVIYLTAYTDREKVERAQSTEPYGYLVKPFDERELRTTIDMSLYKAEADRKLRENQRWANAVLTSIADAVITLDRNAKVRYLNSAAERLTGWTQDSAAGQSLDEIMVLSDDKQELLLKLSNYLVSKEAVSSQTEILDALLQPREGTAIHIDITMCHIRHDGDSEHDGIIVAFRDVTLQHQAQEVLTEINSSLEQRVQERTRELISAREQAEVASEAKSRFLTNMSHEVRTPLIPIIGYAELLATDDKLPTGYREQATEIITAGQHLLGLFDDILEIAQSDTGELEIQSIPFDLVELVKHAVVSHSDTARNKGLELTSILPDTDSPIVLGDMGRIREVLNRILDNAIRFTDSGMVKVNLDCTKSSDDHIQSRITVVDTGIGITDKVKIFEPLTQLDDSMSRQHDGAGLGLAISQRLVKLMDGKIGVEDNPGGGAKFWFELELPVAAQ